MTRRPGRARAVLATAALLALPALASGCGGDEDPAGEASPSSASTGPDDLDSGAASDLAGEAESLAGSAEPTGDDGEGDGGGAPGEDDRRVLVISLDGFNPDAMRRLGRGGAPNLWRVHDEGAATLDARTAVEMTVTLPNHTSMVTGRRIAASDGGHGVTFNEEQAGVTVDDAAGEDVASVFSVVADDGGSTALFAGKDKFALFERTWGADIDRFVVDADPAALVDAAVDDLTGADRRLTFLHVALPDTVGHAAGWMSAAYLDAVRRTDGLVGEVLDAVDADRELGRDLAVVVTADHGGPPGTRDHGDAALAANYTIPFLVWGAGVEQGDLYDLNPDYADPGDARPGYDGPQPVRNGDVADLATDLLGLGPVPGSQLDADQDLGVTVDDSTG